MYRVHDGEIPCVWRNLEGPEKVIKARFLAMLDEQPLDINISYLWGGWLRLVASRIGINQALDDAMLCCVAGVVAHHDRSPENLVVASRIYGQALASIQRALTDHGSAKLYSSETITAAKYLTAFEVSHGKRRGDRKLINDKTLLDLNGDSWEKHWRGLERLLANRGCHDDEDDLLKSLYYQILGHYVGCPRSASRLQLTGT